MGTVDLLQVETDILEASRRFADLLAEAPDGAARVKGLDWTVGELGAHVATVLDWPSYSMAWVDVARPGAHPAYNEQLLRRFPERDPRILAEIVENRGAEAVERFGDDPTRRVFAFGLQRDVSSYAAILLGEVLIHERDLARTLRKPWSMTADQARGIFAASLPVLPYLVDREVARDLDSVVFDVRLRGAKPVVFRVGNGTVAIEAVERAYHADVHIAADPVTYVLLGYRRVGVVSATLGGKLYSWGARPWLAFKLRRLFRSL